MTKPKAHRQTNGSMASMARVLAYLYRHPSTARQIADVYGWNECRLRELLDYMETHGLCHRAGKWLPPDAKHHNGSYLWRFGPGTSIPRRSHAFRTCHPSNRIAFVTMVVALLERPVTRRMLMEVSGVHDGVVKQLIDTLRTAKLIHVERWTYVMRQPVAMFRLGYGVDAPRPRPRREERAEYERACRAKRKKWKDTVRAAVPHTSIFRAAEAGHAPNIEVA